MAQNEQVYAICCRPEVYDDVISGRNVKTIVATLREILKFLALAVSEILNKNHFVGPNDSGDGGGHRR